MRRRLIVVSNRGPVSYERDADGLPQRWLAMMKASIAGLGERFTTHRMVAEYATGFYGPAHREAAELRAGARK